MLDASCKWKDRNGISRKTISGLVTGLIILIAILLLSACSSGSGDNTPQIPLTFTTSSNADLADPYFHGSLDQPFIADHYDYTASVGFAGTVAQVTTTTEAAFASVSVNNSAASLGIASQFIPPGEGSDLVTITAGATDDISTETYSLLVERQSTNDFLQQAYLKASNPDNRDRFGFGLSSSGDTLAMGASGEDSNATGLKGDESSNLEYESGAAYVFQ